MKEIGGYFELDPAGGLTPLPEAVLVNSGCSALRHIVRQCRIRSIWVPSFTCPVVWNALAREDCEIKFYSLGADMLPAEELPRNDFVLYTNYFGCCGKNVELLAAEYPNLIIDCAQAYYANLKGLASFSSPRKFFGVADGGMAFGVEGAEYEQDDSSARQQHLILRKEQGAAAGYQLFKAAEQSLVGAPIRKMSPQTMSALKRVDVVSAKKRRLANFAILHDRLNTSFPLSLAEDDVPMVYPYVTDDVTLRSRLIAQKIYVAKYWPKLSSAANTLAERIVPLPIDQRYGEEEMERLMEIING